jgi:hypothetical protein
VSDRSVCARRRSWIVAVVGVGLARVTGYVIENGCSGDCFRDFRACLVSLGRDAYAKAVGNPNSLAPGAPSAERVKEPTRTTEPT